KKRGQSYATDVGKSSMTLASHDGMEAVLLLELRAPFALNCADFGVVSMYQRPAGGEERHPMSLCTTAANSIAFSRPQAVPCLGSSSAAVHLPDFSPEGSKRGLLKGLSSK